MKRLGIICLYDNDNIIDEYVYKVISDIKVVLEDLVIVANSVLSDEDCQKLSHYSDIIIQRKNEGYDWGAWKETIVSHIGKQLLENYDELVLLNDTFYGPFYSFKEVFCKMEESEPYDFWGITIHGALQHISEHVQSYFLVIRNRMLHSDFFWKYWENLRTYVDVNDTILLNEVYFTKFFSEKGFSYGAYCDTRFLENGYTQKVNHYFVNYYELVKKFRCPILKKKIFGRVDKSYILQFNHADELKQTIEYIEKTYEYDISLIFKNLLRTTNIATLYDAMNLNYIISESGEKKIDMITKRVCVICYIHYEDLIEYCLSYIKVIPNYIDIYIVTDKKTILTILQSHSIIKALNVHCISVSSIGGELATFFIGCQKVLMSYDYICFIHDAKLRRDDENVTVEKTFCNSLWNNLLKSKSYILNIISLLEREKYLGLLIPPFPNYGNFRMKSDSWEGCFESTKRFLKSYGIIVPMNKEKKIFSVGNSFWVKRIAIQKLLQQECTLDFFLKESLSYGRSFYQALEQSLPYVVQGAGFYTGVVMNDNYASAELNILESEKNNCKEHLYKLETKIDDFTNRTKSLSNQLAEREIQLAVCENQLAEREIQLAACENQLTAITQSKAWRVACYLRTIKQLACKIFFVKRANEDEKIDCTRKIIKASDHNSKIAVQVHIYFADLCEEINTYLNNIPCDFDCFISTDNEEKAEFIEKIFREKSNAKNIELLVGANRGRDVGLFLVQMSNVIFNYNYFCHIHTKKSKHTDFGDGWRKYLLDELLGSKEKVMDIIKQFEVDDKLGIIFPKTYSEIVKFIPGGNNTNNRILLNRYFKLIKVDIQLLNNDFKEFPVGDMFWGRSNAFTQVFSYPFTLAEFPEETGQLDQTIMHGIERSWVYIAEYNSYHYKILNI